MNKRKEVSCFVCEEKGHNAKKCRQKKANNTKSRDSVIKDKKYNFVMVVIEVNLINKNRDLRKKIFNGWLHLLGLFRFSEKGK